GPRSRRLARDGYRTGRACTRRRAEHGASPDPPRAVELAGAARRRPMSDTRKILERGVGGFAPRPGAYQRVLDRRDRTRRNARVATVLLVLAITVALIVVGTSVRHRDEPITVSPVPTVGAVGAGLSRVDPNTGAINPVHTANIARSLGGIDVSPDG